MEVLKFLILVCHVRKIFMIPPPPPLFFFNAKQHPIPYTIGDRVVILFHLVDS